MREEEEATKGYGDVAKIVAIGLVLIGVIVAAAAGLDIWLSGGELSPTTAGVLSTIAAGSLTVLSAYFTARAGGKAVAAAMEATMKSQEEMMKIKETYPSGRVVEIDTSDGEIPDSVEIDTEEVVEGEWGDEPSWDAPDAPGDSEWPSEDDDTDLEDWGEGENRG